MAAGTEDYLLLSGIQHFVFAAVNGPSSTWSSSGVKTSIPPRGGWNTPAAMTIHCLKNGGTGSWCAECRSSPTGCGCPAFAMWWNSGPIPPGSRYGAVRACGCRCRWSISTAEPRKAMPTGSSFARRPWLWRRCWSAKSPPVRCFMKKQDAGSQFLSRRSCAGRRKDMADEMHRFFARGYTPKVRTGKHCKACSLRGLCLPGLDRRADAAAYIHGHVDEVAVPEGEVGLP